MRLDVTPDGLLRLKEVYSGVLLETSEGNCLGICMRDDTFELNILPKGAVKASWHRVNMATKTIEKEDCSATKIRGGDTNAQP